MTPDETIENLNETIRTLTAEIDRLSDELAGKRSSLRSLVRRFAFSFRSTLKCPCGAMLQHVEQWPPHADHFADDPDWVKAAKEWDGTQ